MAGTIAIKNGYVFDHLNEINGEIIDIFIREGKVVRELSAAELKDAKIIDASGMTVMPGGVDSHSHVAGAKVNAGRSMRPEDHYKANLQKTSLTHSGSGIPNVRIQSSQDRLFMPRAIWSNVIVDPYTLSTGSPLCKGAPVTIEPTDEEVLSAEDVVLKIYIGGR